MTYEAYVLSQSPQLYIPWTETSGTTYGDLSGHAHDATPSGAVVTAGGIDGAVRGERAAVWTGPFTDFGNVATMPCRGAFTWLLWARVPSTGFNWYRMATHQGSSFLGTHMLMALVSNTESLPYYWQVQVIGPGGNGFAAYEADVAVLECWHQFAMTWDGTSLNIYKDGAALVPTAFAAPTPSIWNTPNTPDVLSVSQFAGSIDVNHMAMYARALSGAEIAADYAAAVPLNDCLPHGVRLTLAPDGGAARQTVQPGSTERLTING